MMMHRLKYLLLAVLAWGAAACNEDDTSDPDFKVYSSKSDLRIRTAGEVFPVIVHARGPWSVAQCPEWASVVPSQGEGSCEVTVAVTANADYIRRGELRFAYGDRSQTLLLRQNGLIIRGLPVRWLFSVANYLSGKYNDAFVRDNALPAESGRGSLGFFQAPENAAAASIERSVAEDSGQPMACGVLPGDYWLFRAAVDDAVAPGTKLQVAFQTRSSGAGPRFWMVEYRDGDAWLPLGEVLRGEIEHESVSDAGEPLVEVETFEYTVDLVKDLTGRKVIGTDNASVALEFAPKIGIAAGADIEVRMRCVSAFPCIVPKPEPDPEPETPESSKDPESPSAAASRAEGDAAEEPAAEEEKGFNRIAGTANAQPTITVVNTEFAGIE